VAVVLMQALNPATHGILKVIGGFRQELQWVPCFFFGYLIMRSKLRFRQLFLIFGVIALANGVVGAYQARISPQALASWGPGYGSKVRGHGASGSLGVSGRTYTYEGEGRNRPPGLGADAGAAGGAGVLALPGLLALLVIGRLRRRWIALLCCAGALLAIASSASRQGVVITVVALLSYAGLSLVAGLKITRLFAALLVAIALTVGVGAYLQAENGPGVFKRQETITSVKGAEETGGAQKLNHLTALPRDVVGAPFGAGLGTGAAAGGFGGKQKIEIEGEGVSREGALNLIVVELGAPGLLLWIGLTLTVMSLPVLRLRHIADRELRTYLVAVFAVYYAYTASGFGGPTPATAGGSYLWFAAGIAAYWFAGPGHSASRRTMSREDPRRMIAAPAG
jgi:O-antigen ligase